VEVVIGEESLMHQALVVVAAVVAVVATLDEIETETETETETEISIEMIEFLLQGGMNLFHLEVEMKAGVLVVEGVLEVIGVRVRGPVRSAHRREEETVMIDSSSLTSCPLLLMYDISSFLQA
jgi:hypothetical protein